MDNDYIVKLGKPHVFEGKEYNEIDLSDIEKLTGKDLTDAEKMFTGMGEASPLAETNTLYCFIIAHKATRLPLEFFQSLVFRDAAKIKRKVSNLFFHDEISAMEVQ